MDFESHKFIAPYEARLQCKGSGVYVEKGKIEYEALGRVNAILLLEEQLIQEEKGKLEERLEMTVLDLTVYGLYNVD